MRYDDASGSFSSAQAGTPDARDDADALATPKSGSATGNTITGAGTITGLAGADLVPDGKGHIVALEGAGGSDTSDGGRLHVGGRYGDLTMDTQGNYTYKPAAGTPDGVRDVFRYTLADAEGERDSAMLTIDIGREVEKIDANAQQIVPGPDGVVTLPPGVELSDVHVVGRNLVIDMPDGTQMVIIDGAVFVPQLVLNGVEVPATNLAALLIDSEPKPAGGIPQSSGGNFDVPVPPLDPGVPLGDLIPPTELTYNPPEFHEVNQFVDQEPEIFVQPDGQPATIAAVDSVDEKGLPERDGNLPDEPAGSGEIADGNGLNDSDSSEATTGVIIVNSPDDPSVVRINGVVVTGVVGQEIDGQFGTLTITSFSDGQIGYSYVLTDNNLLGNNSHDDFSVSVTDNDGDVATATLTINIVDDSPTARNDTDATVDGVATGNVMTDAAPGDLGDTDTNAADTVGADNATLTSVSGAGGSDSTFSEGVLNVNGQFGSLVIDAQGNYTYTKNPNAGGGGVDVFTYTLTDGDGDTTTATLTITNPDLIPDVPENVNVGLDDDALAGGNPGTPLVNDDPDSVNTTGSVAATSGDGTITYSLSASGAPAGFSYALQSNGDLWVMQGSTHVLTVTLDQSGNYSVTQVNPIDHATANLENNATFTVTFRATDADLDFDEGTFSISVDDDTPIINREDVSAPTLGVDETDLTTNASGDFSGLFEVKYGADGPGTTSYAVSVVNGTDSGLVDVATGQSILLFNNAGVVEGRVGGSGGAVAFTVSVNATTGVVTLDQIRALDHPDATDPDDPVSPNADSIQFTVTAIDADGDPISDTINIGANFVFDDDGPSTPIVSAAGFSISHDETPGDDSDADDVVGPLSVFAGVTNPGNDPHVAGTVIGYAVSTGAISVGAASDFGADGPGTTTTYALAVSAQGVDSGLNLTDGTSVFLFLEDGLVVGRAGTDATDAADNPAAFALAIDATTGQVSMVQYLSLQHPNPSNPDESISITNGAVLATATVTDGDNDPATGSLAIGSLISFQDDAPDAQVADVATDTLVLDETIPVGTETDGDSDPVGRTTITADFSNNFATTINYGADGPAASGNVSYSLVLTGTNVASGLYALDPTDTTVGDGDGIGRGTQIVLNQSGNTITGTANGQTYFTISINPSTGVVTFTQNIPIWHANTGSDDDTSTLSAVANSLVVRQTVTDGDGDSDTADIDLSNGIFQIEDDGPVANPDTDTVASGTATGNVITDLAAGDSGDSDSGADDVGADTPGRVSLIDNGSVPGPALEVPAGGSVTIDGAYGTLQIFSNGNYTYTRTDGLGGGQSETFTYTLMDADGDTTTSTLTIAIPDATPVLATPPALQLDDDDALSGGGNPGGPSDDDVSVPLGGTLSGSGGDGDLDYYFAASQTAPAGFTYNVTTGATTQTLEITQTSTGLIVATITLTNETGVYTVVQNNPVSHPSQDGVLGLDNTENNTPNFNIAFVARDIDTDPSNVVNLVLNIDDDTPVLSNVASGVGVTIDETSAVSISGFPIVAVGASAAITATQAFGADGAAAANSVVYGLSIVGDSPELTTLRTAVGDNLITLVQIDANTIQGQYSGSTVAFQIDIGTDGKLTLTQYVPLEHTTDGSSASAHDDTLNLSGFVNATITITDKDGDSTTASAPIGNQIVFHDDGPDAQLSGQSAGTVTLDETRPEGSDRAGAAPTGTDSETIDFKTAFVTGGSVDYGADGPGTVAYSLVLTGTNVPSGLYALQGTDISLAGVDGDGYGQGDQIVLNQTSTNTITGSVNGTDYFTLTINPTTGVVTFTQLANIWHPTPGTSSFDETATLNTAAASDIKVIQTVTDSDGDFDTAEVNVGRGVFNIQDDGPQAIQPQEATVEDTAGESATGVPLDDDGSLVGDFGTDLPGRVTFANITPDGMPTSETAGGATIELWLSADGQTLQGRTGSTNGTDGNLIYTVQINSNGTYDFNLVDEIDNGSGSTFANLSGGVAGNPPFKLIQSSSADTLELLATPINGGSINSDTDDMGVDSQFVDTTDGADKGVRLDFGDFTYETNSGGTSDDAFIMVNHSTINGFRFAIDQVSNGTTADVRLKALDADEDGGLEEQAPDPTGDVVDPITMVKIYSVAEVSGVIVYTLVGTYTADGAIGATGATIDFEVGGTVLIDNLPAGYAIQTYTADGYDRIEITNPGNNDSGDTDGKYSLSLFSIETTDQGDPIDLYFDVAITDADGDSVVVTDAIHVNVDPAGSSSLAAALPMVVSQEALTDSSELLLMASTVDQQRTMSAANNNSVLLGAIAAAGLGSSVAAAAHDTTLAGHDVVFQAKSISDGFGLRQGASVDDDEGSRSALGGETREALVDQLELSSSSQHNAVAAVQSLTGNDSHPAQVVTELLQGTEALQLSAPQQSSFTSGAVGMPSAEMLATVSANAIAIDAQSRHTGEVGRVLADALAGGGHGPNIDAVIDAVTNQGHPVKAGIEALASQGPAGVSGWDMSAFAGFQGPHSAIMMEHVMVLHPDAVQPAA